MTDTPKDLGIDPTTRALLDEEAAKYLDVPASATPPRPSFFEKVRAEVERQGLDVEGVKGETIRSIPLEEIIVGENRRQVDDDTVDELVQSIKALGLLNPITITPAMRLVAGLHRKIACERLGWTHIIALVKGYDVLHAELAEIDENLIRADLNAMERGEQSSRRKRVYLALYPETAKGVAGGKAGGKGRAHTASERVSFAEDTAKKTGKTTRSVQMDVQMADGISQDVRDKLRKHEVANNKTELLKLARVKNQERQREVAKMLQKGEAKNVTDALRTLRLRDRHERNAATNSGNEDLDSTGERFTVLCPDPPWQYEHSISVSRDIEEQYPTMTVEQICEMPVEDHAEDDSVLFLWCPASLVKHGLKVIEAWGFDYRTMIVWDKESVGPGFWVRSQHELLLIAVKGKPPTPEAKNRPPSVIRAPRGKHSEKPQLFYDIIEKMYPKASRLEMFARKKRAKWTCWGNQAKGDAA